MANSFIRSILFMLTVLAVSVFAFPDAQLVEALEAREYGVWPSNSSFPQRGNRSHHLLSDNSLFIDLNCSYSSTLSSSFYFADITKLQRVVLDHIDEDYNPYFEDYKHACERAVPNGIECDTAMIYAIPNEVANLTMPGLLDTLYTLGNFTGPVSRCNFNLSSNMTTPRTNIARGCFGQYQTSKAKPPSCPAGTVWFADICAYC